MRLKKYTRPFASRVRAALQWLRLDVKPTRTVCMVAYANYFTDARIKNYVTALLKVGYSVDVFALGKREPAQPGVRVFCLMPKVASRSALPYALSQLWFLALVTFRLSLETLRRRYDFVHVHNMPDFLVFSCVIPRLRGSKVILDVHDTMPESYATKFDLSLRHPLIAAIRLEERLSAHFADHVITTQNLHKEALAEHGIPSGKISIVMNLGNEAIFYPRPRTRRDKGLTLVYHGTITQRLGIDLVLDALRRARVSCPDLQLLLIGDGEYMPTVRRLVVEYGLGDIVATEGWVPVERLPDYISQADVGVIGNRSHIEVRRNWMLPVKMLECAAMEIPTIAPRLRAIQSYFDDSTALFYEPDDPDDLARCIREVYTCPERLVHMKHGLREFNALYNWSVMERRYIELVKSLVEQQPGQQLIADAPNGR